MISESELLHLMSSKKYRPMKRKELAQKAGVKRSDRKAFKKLIERMELDGLVVEVKKKRLALPGKVGLVVGTLTVNPRGFGFVIPKTPDVEKDIFVAEGDMGTAIDRDVVVVRLQRPTPKRGPAGKVISIVQRGRDSIVGTYRTTKRFAFCAPDDTSIVHNIYLDPSEAMGAKSGDKIVVRVTEWPSRHSAPEGHVIEVLGAIGEEKVDLMSVIRGYGLPDKFSKAARGEARRCGKSVKKAARKDRRDLTELLTITIDPEDAKDFDDAVSIEFEGKKKRLYVHIADVTHYVEPGGPLDEAARERGTSVYFPGTVIPMLPETLSNGLCSLRPEKVRLAKTVEMVCDGRGKIVETSVYRSVIRSDHRLNYAEALDMIKNDSDADEELVKFVKSCHKLAEKLKEGRRKRGMLELDIANPTVKLDEFGDVAEITVEKSDEAHSLIEEFMIAANETVAEFLCTKKLPGIFRIHPEPPDDAFSDFAQIARNMGFQTSAIRDRKGLQRLLKKCSGSSNGRMVHYAMLRAMQHAEYVDEAGAHFALASSAYLHFTSPIRRYPDLIVHRVLDAFFDGKLKSTKQRKEYRKGFYKIAAHCSYTEKRAEDAERDLVKLKVLEYLQAHRRRVYPAVISAVRQHGLIVDVEPLGIPGFVRLSSLEDDFYQLDEKNSQFVGRATGRKFTIGDEVNVRLSDVDMIKREADFVLAAKK